MRKHEAAQHSRSWNPLFDDLRARELSTYAAPVDGRLAHPLRPGVPVGDELSRMHVELVNNVLGEGYPCVGARSAFNRRGYRLGLYPELAGAETALAVCHDLYEFCHEFQEVGSHFVTFIAGFAGPRIESELHYEGLIWQQLQRMHEIDCRHFRWDPKVADDAANSQFSFSIGGRAFFIVGLHPQASRRARTMPRAIMVFNLHEQFDRLRERGKFESMKQMIRARDIAFQGSINPVLEDFGRSSEARQYSGRAVPDDWACPFHRIHEDDTK
ncbi:MAG: guanitoxin biosynthesis heme-dependent pre-guanitoxin N-hydroxylase GntA [Methyloceanibacter sp.]